MSSEMVEMFFWSESSSNLNPIQFLQNQSNTNTNNNNLVLLSGPPSSGKTSLIFQFAFNVALHSSNSNVIFICNRHRFDSKPPFLSQGIDPSSDVFHRIQMKYVNDDQDIRNFFAAFHLFDTLPAALVIDDFGHFFDNKSCQQRYSNSRGRELAMVKTLALCHNAITYANQKGSCKLVLSDILTHHGDSPRFQFIYNKWIHTTFTIKEGDVCGSFILKEKNSNTGKNKAAKYSIALQYLALDEIVEDQIE
ncbi:hypothetical protein HN51_010696 [Arachis hypogaea]